MSEGLGNIEYQSPNSSIGSGGAPVANNGLSVAGGTTIQLGGPNGVAGAAALLGDREIPMANFNINLSGLGASGGLNINANASDGSFLQIQGNSARGNGITLYNCGITINENDAVNNFSRGLQFNMLHDGYGFIQTKNSTNTVSAACGFASFNDLGDLFQTYHGASGNAIGQPTNGTLYTARGVLLRATGLNGMSFTLDSAATKWAWCVNNPGFALQEYMRLNSNNGNLILQAVPLTTAPTDNGSKFQLGGSLSVPIVSSAVSLALDATMHTIVLTAGALVVTLPAAAAAANRVYAIINQAAASTTSINYINFAGAAVNTIAANAPIWLQSNGVNWIRIV